LGGKGLEPVKKSKKKEKVSGPGIQTAMSSSGGGRSRYSQTGCFGEKGKSLARNKIGMEGGETFHSRDRGNNEGTMDVSGQGRMENHREKQKGRLTLDKHPLGGDETIKKKKPTNEDQRPSQGRARLRKGRERGTEER